MSATPANNLAFIAVGSNIKPESNVLRAARLLAEKVRLLATSTFYQTEPLGRIHQPPYVNGVWLIETDLPPLDTKQVALLQVESRLGRMRTSDKYAPRPIDLDLVFYEDMQCRTADLRLPHPDLARPFVHQPLDEILNTHPGLPHWEHWKTILARFKTGRPCGLPKTGLTQTLQHWLSPP